MDAGANFIFFFVLPRTNFCSRFRIWHKIKRQIWSDWDAPSAKLYVDITQIKSLMVPIEQSH